MTVDRELSAGVVAYLQRGAAASPRADETACASVAVTRPREALVAEVKAIVEESVGISVDWSSNSLGEGGRLVASQMRERHPELDESALDALAWNFTFVWR